MLDNTEQIIAPEITKCEYKKNNVKCPEDIVEGCGIKDSKTKMTLALLCQKHHDYFWHNIKPFLEEDG